jgi:hypothetical protein
MILFPAVEARLPSLAQGAWRGLVWGKGVIVLVDMS